MDSKFNQAGFYLDSVVFAGSLQVVFDLNGQLTSRCQDESLWCVVDDSRSLLLANSVFLGQRFLVGNIRVDQAGQDWQTKGQRLSTSLKIGGKMVNLTNWSRKKQDGGLMFNYGLSCSDYVGASLDGSWQDDLLNRRRLVEALVTKTSQKAHGKHHVRPGFHLYRFQTI